MNYWKNTKTLDLYVPELADCCTAKLAEIAVVGGKSIDLDLLPRLRGIFKCGVGKDNIPFEECRKRGIEICFPSVQTQNIIFEETANFAVYLIFRMLYTNIGNIDTWVKNDRQFLGRKNVLLIGAGNIGSYVKSKLSPSLNVITYDVAVNSPSELPRLMAIADVVSLHIPLIKETKSFIDKEKLSWMKDGASLVNTARGPIVDEDDLYHELLTKRIRAAFDVYWEEPYAGKMKKFHPDQFFMTPHTASTCSDFLEGLACDLRAFTKDLQI